MSKHAFVPSGEFRRDRAGRLLAVCGECSRVNVGLIHARPGEAVPVPDQREAQETALPDPWEVRMLQDAVEHVLALPVDALGWRLRLRVLDVQKAFSEGRGDAPLARDPVLDEPPARTRVRPSPVTRPSRRAAARKMLRGLDTSWKELAEHALDEGWQVSTSGTGHLRFTSPAGKVVITPASPGGGRGLKNARAQFRRSGLTVP